MLKIPYTDNNTPVETSSFTEQNLKLICQQHQGRNFGVVTGSPNNIIAIKIVIPQLKIGLLFDEGFYVICKESIDPKEVLNCEAEGYIVLKTENIDLKFIDFTKYLYGIHVLGNTKSIPCHGNADNEGNIYCGYGEIEDTGHIDIHRFKNAYKKLEKLYDIKGEFYSQFTWEDFYRGYFPDLKRIHNQIFANNKICVNSSGLFKCGNVTGYPPDFLRLILDVENVKETLLDFCGEVFVFGDNYKMIVEKDNGYYLVKDGKSKRITNWTADRISFQRSKYRHSIFCKRKRVYMNHKRFTSISKIRNAFLLRQLRFFTDSETLIYELLEALIYDDVLYLKSKKGRK